MNTYWNRFLLGWLIFGMSWSVFAQDGTTIVVRDVESWISAGAEIKLGKKFSFSVSEQLRLNTNSSKVDQFFTELGVGYSPMKGLKLGMDFRFARDQKTAGGFESQYRFNFDVSYKHKIVKRLKIKYRLRYQFGNDWGNKISEGNYHNHGIRLKTGLAYNIKKLPISPKFSVELFNDFSKNVPIKPTSMRFVAGADYNLKKFGEVGAFYALDQELTGDYAKTTSIIGVNYKYTLKIKKKKKEGRESPKF